MEQLIYKQEQTTGEWVLDKQANSWWSRNKNLILKAGAIGIGGGLILGAIKGFANRTFYEEYYVLMEEDEV